MFACAYLCLLPSLCCARSSSQPYWRPGTVILLGSIQARPHTPPIPPRYTGAAILILNLIYAVSLFSDNPQSDPHKKTGFSWDRNRLNP